MRYIMEQATLVNQYLEKHQPWRLAKDPQTLPEVQPICTLSLNAFRLLMTYLKPVLPTMAHAVETLLNIPL